jgi:DNA invertase Pin-like site-specific DNA recombinase
MTRPKATLGYIRTSTIEQARKFSPTSQRDAIAYYAKSNGDSIDEWLEDHETATTVNRKNFQQICQRVAAGGVAKIYVNFVDRFARNTEDCLRTVREFHEKGAQVYFADMPGIDLTTPHGELMLTNYAAFATFEHRRIRDRSIQNREKKMAGGQPDSWCLPYGLTVKDGYPCAVPEEAKCVVQVYQWRASGKSYYDIRALLLQSKWKSARGGEWPLATIANMLVGRDGRGQRAYIGVYRRCGRDWPILDKEGKLIQIVSQELFDAVQRVNSDVGERRGRPATRHDFLFHRWIHCDRPGCRERCRCINQTT